MLHLYVRIHYQSLKIISLVLERSDNTVSQIGSVSTGHMLLSRLDCCFWMHDIVRCYDKLQDLTCQLCHDWFPSAIQLLVQLRTRIGDHYEIRGWVSERTNKCSVRHAQ